MKKDKPIDVLHCGPHGGGWGGWGGRSRLPIEAEIVPVHGQVTIFSLPHACLASGLLPIFKKQSLNWNVLIGLANQKWKGSVDQFFEDAKKEGVTKETVNQRINEFKGAIIGWEGTRMPPFPFGICPDLNLTLTILSRCINDIFISSRDPDFSWNTLFGRAFAFDEELVLVPDLKSKPWSQFTWG